MEKNGKKVEKKAFLWIYPGSKSEILGPKSFFKNFTYAIKTPYKYSYIRGFVTPPFPQEIP
jgi:hypothetical protein